MKCDKANNRATFEDWEAHRATISHLYIEQDATLSEVMATMQRDYRLVAT